MIYIWKIHLQSCSNLLIDTNPRFFLLIKKSNKYFLLELHHVLFTTRDKLGPRGTEQTMSSQEHFHSYRKWWMYESTSDNVLQVARCFLPHRFKRSFTITFL